VNKPLQSYLHPIVDLTRRGDAREESYYFTADGDLFRRMAALGGQLIDLLATARVNHTKALSNLLKSYRG